MEDLFPESVPCLFSLIRLPRRLIEFSFDCGIETVNEKMSIPLLSVCLATLMALFRDNELSHKVSQDNLTLLIRQTGTALLDNRLGTSSVLDEATASQMVRALNKVRVPTGWDILSLNVSYTSPNLISWRFKLLLEQ